MKLAAQAHTEVLEVKLRIANENTTAYPSTIRLTKTEREWLGKLAKVYKVKMSEVWRLLLQQAITDYICDGEVLALRKE